MQASNSHLIYTYVEPNFTYILWQLSQVGHNAQEGILFTPPYVTNDTAYRSFIRSLAPSIMPSVLDYISTVLYPPIFNGSTPYTDQLGRAAFTLSEASFTCNTNFLNRAYDNNTFAYQFSVPPALHGQDVPYTFYNGPSPAVGNDTVAVALQQYITSFATDGRPSGPGLPVFPLLGTDNELISLDISSISEMSDPTANERCAWWQKALYF